jgi:hypothetical protein
MYRPRHSISVYLVAIAATITGPAEAGEMRTFTYDGLGRMVAVTVKRTGEAPILVTTDFDPAGNRTRYATSGASGDGPGGDAATSSLQFFVAIPLNGFTIVPVSRTK